MFTTEARWRCAKLAMQSWGSQSTNGYTHTAECYKPCLSRANWWGLHLFSWFPCNQQYCFRHQSRLFASLYTMQKNGQPDVSTQYTFTSQPREQRPSPPVCLAWALRLPNPRILEYFFKSYEQRLHNSSNEPPSIAPTLKPGFHLSDMDINTNFPCKDVMNI